MEEFLKVRLLGRNFQKILGQNSHKPREEFLKVRLLGRNFQKIF